MRDLLRHTTLVHRLQKPMVLALLIMELNFLPLRPLVAMIMVASPTISPPLALAQPVHLIRVVLVAGHLEALLVTQAPALLSIRRVPLTRQPLRSWVWPVRFTTHRLECRQPARPSPLPLQHTVQHPQALDKLVLLPHLHNTRRLLRASPPLHPDTRRHLHNIHRPRRHSVQHLRRLQHLQHTARHLQAGARPHPLMPVPLANRPHPRLHSIPPPPQRLALRHQPLARRLRLIRRRVQLSIHLQEVRALPRVLNTRQTVQRAPSTLQSELTRIRSALYCLLTSILARQRKIEIEPRLYHQTTAALLEHLRQPLCMSSHGDSSVDPFN
jgi:hypothetical protein